MNCIVSEHKIFNESKALVCIDNLSVPNDDYFSQKIKTCCNLQDAESAIWIKNQNPNTKLYLLTFEQLKPPMTTINFAGRTLRVSEYKHL